MKSETFVSAESYLKDLVGQIVTVDPKILTVDKTNPNFMSKKKITQLSKVIDKYGWLYPIIIDTEGNIIDGHQRLQAAIDLGISPPALVVSDVSEVDKKFLRQWLNKFRGTHDPELDFKEIESLFEDEVGSILMEDFMDFKIGNLDEMRKVLTTPADDEGFIEPPTDKKRRIVLYFTSKDFPTYRKKLDDLMEKYEVADETTAIMHLLDET